METLSILELFANIMALGIGFIVLFISAGFIITAISLYLSGKIVKSTNDEFMSAVKTIGIWFAIGTGVTVLSSFFIFLGSKFEGMQSVVGGTASVLSILFFVGTIYTIKKIYDLSIGKSILMLIISGVINGVIGAILAIFFAGSFISIIKSTVESELTKEPPTLMEEKEETISGSLIQKVYLGAGRNEFLANGEKFKVGTQTLIETAAVFNDQLYLHGVWDIQNEYAENKSPNSIINYRNKAEDIYMLLSAEKPVRVIINQNAKYLKENAGEDVDENSYMTVYEERLYHVVKNIDNTQYNKLELVIEDSGLKVFYFKAVAETETAEEENEVVKKRPRFPEKPEEAKVVAIEDVVEEVMPVELPPEKVEEKIKVPFKFLKKYSSIYSDYFVDERAVVIDKEGNRFHVDLKGEPVYGEKYALAEDYVQGRARVKDHEGNWFHIDLDGSRLYEENYGLVSDFIQSRSLVRTKDKTYFHIGLDGKPIYEEIYSNAGEFSESRASVEDLEGNWFHIDIDGNRLYDESYTNAGNYHAGRANVSLYTGTRNQWFHIDLDGNRLYDENYLSIGNFQEGRAVVEDLEGNWFHIDLDGNRFYDESYSLVKGYKQGKAWVKDEEESTFYIDLDGNRI